MNPDPAKTQAPTSFNFGGAMMFALGNATNWPALSAYWDRVIVNEIKVRVVPEWNVAIAGVSLLPTMRVVMDYDDASAPSSSQVWARRGKTHRLDKPFSFSFKPKVLYTSGTGLNLIQKVPYLNNTSAGGVNLYGVKFGVRDWPSLPANAPYSAVLRFEITYCVTMKEQQWINVPINVADLGLIPANQSPTVPTEYIDVSGNIYDISGNMIKAPDEFGWEHAWTGPTGLPYTGPTGPNVCNC